MSTLARKCEPGHEGERERRTQTPHVRAERSSWRDCRLRWGWPAPQPPSPCLAYRGHHTPRPIYFTKFSWLHDGPWLFCLETNPRYFPTIRDVIPEVNFFLTFSTVKRFQFSQSAFHSLSLGIYFDILDYDAFPWMSIWFEWFFFWLFRLWHEIEERHVRLPTHAAPRVTATLWLCNLQAENRENLITKRAKFYFRTGAFEIKLGDFQKVSLNFVLKQ